jgi:hypothetical protein
MRRAELILLAIAVSGGGVAVAQSERAAPDSAEDSRRDEAADDEVIVTGKRIGELRLEVRAAREHAYNIFNEINSTNDFDVRCADQTRAHSHQKVWVCKPRFESRLEAEAAREYLQALVISCRGPAGVTQACMFSPAGDRGISRAQGIEGPKISKREQMNEEIVRLANENPRFAQAILDFAAKNQEYEAARKTRDD